jgi:hypothetical protein
VTRPTAAPARLREGTTLVSALATYGSGLRTGPSNNLHLPGHLRIDATLAHQFAHAPLRPQVAFDLVNLLDARALIRAADERNPPHWLQGRSAFVRVSANF